ncbi:right-handed parallel beta-helix repeat-containing protein [Rossellomorea marisflavi]|uniref:right-handed parallel beta-helix repeat-containing protein n=1 Tax=Rossellomorea marisflavi TaxID=189381 RepID=UPI00279F1984|nr:right-handed parallel beta-helix repeat-containing protein [Rossellomorea marisflavi]UTE72774.1 right-handed parallel beta-helix repeat-containing protein [Rossellomorea marisflavi]
MKRLGKGVMVFLAIVMVMGVVLPVSAATTTNQEWQSITFGQSTDLDFSTNVLPDKVGVNKAEPEHPGTIDGEIFLESRGGKIAPGHDGLTFYYTTLNPNTENFVLEADLTFHQLGPETGVKPSGGESAGIMVRDVNGPARQDPMIEGYEEVPAASNMFAVGLMRDGISALGRTGVKELWGNPGSNLVNKVLPGSPEVPMDTPIRVKLERTDTSFVMSATFTHLEGSPTFKQEIVGADLVQVLDPDHMQIGFYAARNASMTVDNANLSTSEAHTVPTPEQPEVQPDPSLTILSPKESGAKEYSLKAVSTVDGKMSVYQDGKRIVNGKKVKANDVLAKKVKLKKDKTSFRVELNTSDGKQLVQEWTVNLKVFKDKKGLFVSPNGKSTATGKEKDPLDLDTAIKYVHSGGTIYLLEGTYTDPITISKQYSGEKKKMKTLVPYNGAKVVFDGKNEKGNLLSLNADYWEIVGFELTRSTGNGMRVNGSYNKIDHMTFSFNQNTGFQISGSGSNPDLWPKHNVIANSESHDNRDVTDINADGFAAKLGVGVGNVFKNNLSHNNIDDGWDLFNRTNEGPNMPVTLDGNISYSNGKLSNGYNAQGTSGSGFKVGGEGLPVAHIVKNNLAFDNNMDGFTDNFNPGKIIVHKNIAIDNKRYNFIFRINPYFKPEEQGIFTKNISIKTDPDRMKADFVSGVVDDSNYFFDGERTVNSKGKEKDPKPYLKKMRP